MSYSREKLIKRLRDLRIDHNFTQQKIAELLGCERSTYTYYETGKCEPSISSLSLLADFYQVSVDYLLDRTDVTKPYPKAKKK